MRLGLSRSELLVLLVIAVLVAILFPAIQSARQAASKMGSENNLKQLGLAFHNYHDSYKCLPPGAFAVRANDGHLGWTFPAYAFMESSAFGSQVDTDHAWDSMENRYRFLQPLRGFCNPCVREEFTSDGQPLMHYMVNPAFFHMNHSCTLQSAAEGTSHAWFVGEIAGDYQPWGYPFNWRELTAPLNATPSSYGRPTKDGALFVMADASIQFVMNEVDPKLLGIWTSNPPLPEPELIQRPKRRFDAVRRATGYEWKHHDIPESRGQRGGSLQVSAYLSPGRVEFVELRGRIKESGRGFELRDVLFAKKLYPQAEELSLPMEMTDDVASAVSDVHSLQRLRFRISQLSEIGLQTLSQMPRLRIVRIDASDHGELEREQLRQLRAALPHCEVRSRDFPTLTD